MSSLDISKKQINLYPDNPLLSQVVAFYQSNKKIILGVLSAILIVAIVWPSYQYYRSRQARLFGEALYALDQARLADPEDKTLSQQYRDLLSRYSSLPAVRLVHLRLVDLAIKANDNGAAIALIEAGLQNDLVDVLSTALVMKEIKILSDIGKLSGDPAILRPLELKTLPRFRSRLGLYVADLLIGEGKTAEAKKVVERLAKPPQGHLEKLQDQDLQDSGLMQVAGDYLKLIELGQI